MIVQGIIRPPGDKSITHRVLLLSSLARGVSHIGGALTSLDARSTAHVLRALGAEISPLRQGTVLRIRGRGRYRQPVGRLDCGNSGTTARLLLGLLASHRFSATLTGDRSLRRRPMRRVTDPLRRMGARVREYDGDGLPLTIRGGPLIPLRYELPVSSAQLKSSLLLAGLAGDVAVQVREPSGRSRDHTERLLRSFGYTVRDDDGWIAFEPDGELVPFELQIPGDPSSAAFLVGAALLADEGELTVAGVGLNPTRTGYLDVIRRMQGRVQQTVAGDEQGEPTGDLLAQPSALKRVDVSAEEIPGLIDEIPLLAVLAARAEGTSCFHQVGELRVKESDRLGLIAANLRTLGVEAEVQGEDLYVTGTDQPPAGRVRTDGDHRLAMAFSVMGKLPGAKVRIDEPECADVSFPDFADALGAILAGGGRRG